MIDTRPWFERFPDLESWELNRFAEHGLPVAIDQGRRAAGQLAVATSMPFNGEPIEITVVYPSEYPELPPLVFGPEGLLDRHQQPFGGNFCLLERPLDDWRAADWGAADLLVEQLAALLADSEAGPDVVRAAEAPMPEPASTQFACPGDATVIVPGEFAHPAGAGGTIVLTAVRDNLLYVRALNGQTVEPPAVFASGATVAGKWLRLPHAPAVGQGDGPSVVGWLREHHPTALTRTLPRALVRKAMAQGRSAGQPRQEVVGLVFLEEGPGVGKFRDAWMFIVVDRSTGQERAFLFPAQVLSEAERQRRIPELAGLYDRRVVVLGAGSLGGDVAIELARAGVGYVDIVDYDRFEVTNPVRHPLGIEYAGLPKADSVADACLRTNPFCTPTVHRVKFGIEQWEPGQSPLEVLGRLVERADLVIDMTGSHQIGQFSGRLCAEGEVPIISGWMTDGFFGAEIVRSARARRCAGCASPPRGATARCRPRSAAPRRWSSSRAAVTRPWPGRASTWARPRP
jgi:hypothetical protein